MFKSDELDIWNLTPEGTAYIGAQTIFNVVGELKSPSNDSTLWYALNGSEKKRVFVGGPHRNIRPNHFNIDTINCSDLRENNVLDLWIHDDSNVRQHSIPFSTRTLQTNQPEFELALDKIQQPEEAGQFIDGHWRLSQDEQGEPCLEIRPEDAGYDRLFGIGRYDWTTGYRVDARLCVTKWTGRSYFNVGLLFKWNPHLQGNGDSLPTQWSTGLAYYAAKCPGMRLRFGVDVHFDEKGRKIGSYVLQEKAISFWRRWAGFIRNTFIRIGKTPITQLKSNVHYRFKLLIHPEVYTLDVFEEGSDQPLIQLRVPDPADMLPQGCLGIIACACAVRIYEYSVSPA